MENLKVFAKTIEDKAVEQINKLMGQDSFKNEKVRIMPDVHSGKGCVIGFTSTIGSKIIPNIVGVDLYCGMLLIKLGDVDIDLSKLDEVVKNRIPSGFNVHEKMEMDAELGNLYKAIESMHCFRKLSYNNQIKNGVGTLGGGNHFIEIDIDDEGDKYLVIHSGSRNLGNQVAKIYMERAINYCHGGTLTLDDCKMIIKSLKDQGREKEIQKTLMEAKKETKDNKIEKELCYLENKDKDEYLEDIKVCYKYAHMSRQRMALEIVKAVFGKCEVVNDKFVVNGKELYSFETLHNYIDIDGGIIRKGAISAKKDEIVLIPINMRDGSLICRGLGNDDWNCSAPHGAGRIMSRMKAREIIDIDEYKNSMRNIYSSMVNMSTIDEAPQAYKSMEEIKECIQPTVEIVKQIRPIYNYKAAEE
jgi:RNA-splicing ligase RtcB